MRQTDLTLAIEKVIKIKLQAVDQLMKELVEPLEKIGSPEELLGKPYEAWDANDHNMMIKIYGQGEHTPLTNLVFRKEYEKVKALEAEEII